MGKGALGGFAAGLLAGLDRGVQRIAEQERLDKKEARDTEIYESGKRERDLKEKDNIALRNAAAPVSVGSGATVNLGDGQQHVYDDAGVAGSDVRQANRLANNEAPEQQDQAAPIALGNAATMTPVSTVNGTAYPDRASADAAATKLNDPGAQAERIANVLRAQGKPTEAIQQQQAAQKFADEQWDRQLRDAMTRGHQGIAEFLTKSNAGPLAGKTIKAVPDPDGKTVTYNVVNDDGTMTPTPYKLPNDQNGVITAGYQLSKINPEVRYKHMIEEDKTRYAHDSKERELALRERELLEVKIPNAETRAQLAEVRGQLAELRGARGDNTVSREERLRYTTLFTDAGRRMQDASKQLNTLRADRSFMREAAKAGTPQAQTLQDLQDQLASHKSERDTYQNLLSGSAPAAKDGAAPAAPSDSPTKVDPGTQAGRDTDRVSILNAELTKAQQRLAQGDPRAQQDIDSVTREIQRTQATLAKAKPKVASKPSAGATATPVKVSSKAERDKLPTGARYVGPDGTVYIKN